MSVTVAVKIKVDARATWRDMESQMQEAGREALRQAVGQRQEQRAEAHRVMGKERNNGFCGRASGGCAVRAVGRETGPLIPRSKESV